MNVQVRGTTQASVGRPLAVACPIAPSPEILQNMSGQMSIRNFNRESFPLNSPSSNNTTSNNNTGNTKTTTHLGLRIVAGGMGGQLLGTAVVAVQPPPKLQSESKAPSNKTRPPVVPPMDKPLSVRVSVFEPSWAADPSINRDRLAAAPSAGVSAVSTHGDVTDNGIIDPQLQGNIPNPGTWTNITTRMKAKSLDGINEYGRLIVVIDGLGPVDHSINDDGNNANGNNTTGLASIPEGTETVTSLPPKQIVQKALMKTIERGEAKFISHDEAIQVYSDLTRLLLPDSVIFEIQPFERVALLGGHNSILPQLTTKTTHNRPEDQLQAFAKTRYALLSSIASRIQATLIHPSTVVDRAADSSPLILRSLVSPAADSAVEVIFDRTINHNTVKTGFGRSVYAAVRFLEHPSTYLQQFPLRNTDAMTAYTLAAAKISIAGQPKRKLKPTVHDGLQLIIWDNDTPYHSQIGTISVNTNDLRNIFKLVREDAEKKAIIDNKGKPRNTANSTNASTNNSRSTTPTSNNRSTTPTRGSTPNNNRSTTPNVRRNNSSSGPSTNNNDNNSTTTSVAKPYEQFLSLVTSWPRNIDDLRNDSVTITSWLTNNMTNIYENVPEDFTNYVPSSLVTQSSAVLSHVPNLLNDKDD